MVWCLEPHDMWWVVQSVVPIHCVCPTPLLCLYWEVNYNTTVNYTQGGTGKQIKQYLVFIVKHLFLINMIYSCAKLRANWLVCFRSNFTSFDFQSFHFGFASPWFAKFGTSKKRQPHKMKIGWKLRQSEKTTNS